MDTTNTTALTPAQAARVVSAYRLFTLSDAAEGNFCPDNAESPGGLFLASVRDELIERFWYGVADEQTGNHIDGATAQEGLEYLGSTWWEDAQYEIADGAASSYTAAMFRQFTDLGAWQADISDYVGEAPYDVEQLARLSLYVVARSLTVTLTGDLEALMDAEHPRHEDARGNIPADALAAILGA